MARKSRRNAMAKEARPKTSSRSRTGIYVRLSVEDNGYKDGESIQNQIEFLKDFVQQNEENLQLVDIYADNGTTGTNFDREQWNHLLEDIKTQKINCVLVKDFSRIGRSYIEVGNYLEKVFPFMRIRVISVNDDFDSQKQAFESSMLVHSLKNIANEYYARDISQKVTQAKRTKQHSGEFVSGILPYGYKRSKEDRSKLDVDKEAADIVRKIYEWRMQGKGCIQIANYLNELALPSPGQYRYLTTGTQFKRSENTKWKSKHVAGILKNPIYLGDMVQGRTRSSYFEQGGKLRWLPEEEWIVVKGTHEPLVTPQQFEAAHKMAEESRQRHEYQMQVNAGIKHEEAPLPGKVYCGQCGRLMTRRSRVTDGRRDYLYFCDSGHEVWKEKCKNMHVHEDWLLDVLKKIAIDQVQINDMSEYCLKISQSKSGDKSRSLEFKKKEAERHLSLLRQQKKELYPDLKDGLLSLEEYEFEKNRITEEERKWEKKLSAWMETQQAETEISNIFEVWKAVIEELKNNNDSNRLFDQLFDRVTVFSPHRIEVECSFVNQLTEWSKKLGKTEWLVQILTEAEGEGNE